MFQSLTKLANSCSLGLLLHQSRRGAIVCKFLPPLKMGGRLNQYSKWQTNSRFYITYSHTTLSSFLQMLFFSPCWTAFRILVPWRGMNPDSSECADSYWTTRGSLKCSIFKDVDVCLKDALGTGRGFHHSSIIAQLVKNLPAMQEAPVRVLGQGDPLEKG